ncbi:UV excision repair protein RAD23 [Fistulifera solaris]|uniref:UV excision repair protein RAD23 n=1 Tax=Fistulifera solaris TaxID=1519565 RepID=A0A1Z5KBW7_FISSO|nr:UV excision repair protein RAD23 [Fistulifera solaris]|eukprot:GAX23632.1 UV excision repair protein RAD23 [Fistulifera solaris]
MKLTVKTLKGAKFDVEVEETHTVQEAKSAIEKEKPELVASTLKLIHSGKVLKDEDTIASCGIKPNDFLVVMVTKAKKPAATPATPAETPKEEEPAKAPEVPVQATISTAQTPAAPAAPSVATPAAPTRTDTFSQEAVDNLTAMGFPEAEVRHCLRAAQGNPDVAVEFLTNGIPDAVSAAMNATESSSATPAQATQPLQALRNHPQFNELRRLVQSNPQMLQQVLAQIGQQQPELLEEINSHQALFLEMMNEPVTAAPSSAPTGSRAPTASSESASGMGMPMEGMGNPAQMAQMIQSMSPAELDQMAQMMGLSSDQLRMTAQMLGQMPPEQLQQFMAHMGGGEGHGGQQVLRLTEEEMAAVDRLTEMGFDRSEAAQAFLACDKNEALAANLLMDSMGDGGGFFGGHDDSGNNDSDDNGDGGNDDEDMYD